ncbi:hypothetical protein ACJJTC_010974 [Scirpophaga incertulas]
MTREAKQDPVISRSKYSNDLRLPNRTSSATRLFDKLRFSFGRTRSKMLSSHPEESADNALESTGVSECIKTGNISSAPQTLAIGSTDTAVKETYGCHLCCFDADRITVLDRHLLNNHKIGLDTLLKLVMAKTKEGLNEDSANVFNTRQPYYKPSDEIVEDEEIFIETVSPKIKIVKHSAVNTDIQWTDIPDFKDNCKQITKELEKLVTSADKYDKTDLFAKMQSLSECMCKFFDSTNTLKKVLTKEFESKTSVKPSTEPLFDLGLGDQENSRDWERAHSELSDKRRRRHDSRSGVPKMRDSFYF